MKNQRTLLILSTLFLLNIFTAGCGTIMRGSKDDVSVDTYPQGAHVRATDGTSGITPVILELSRSDETTLTIKKEGYETVEVKLTPRISGGGASSMAGNVLIGGIIGAGVDAATGSMYNLEPNPVMVTLNKIGTTTSTTYTTARDTNILDGETIMGIVPAGTSFTTSQENGDFVLIEYTQADGKTITGWVSKSDMQP